MGRGKLPETLIEAIWYFSDLDVCTEFVAKMRWPEGPVCERCGGVEHSYLSTRRVWKCKGCKRQFSVKVGTIFEDSPLGLDKWLLAVWLIANSKNGISSHELGRALGVTQKSAWFMLPRIRLALQAGGSTRSTASPRSTRLHRWQGPQHAQARAGAEDHRHLRQGQDAVVGALERGGKVRATVAGDRTQATLHGYVKDNVVPSATVYTDSLGFYTGLERD